MASFNKVLLMGRLTRDPELKYTKSGKAICSFGLALNEKFKKDDEWKEKVHFVEITVWGKQAEIVTEHLQKGAQVIVDGKLNYQSWEGDGGKKRNKLEVVANNIQFLDGKKEIRQ